MDVGLITEPRKFLCPLFFSNYLVRLIPHSARTTSGIRAEGSYLGGYGTLHVYGIISVYSTIHVYGTVHIYNTIYVYGTIYEYGVDGHLYLGDSLL